MAIPEGHIFLVAHSSIHEIFAKIIVYKESFNIFQKASVALCIFSDYNAVKLEINNKKLYQKIKLSGIKLINFPLTYLFLFIVSYSHPPFIFMSP